MCLGAGVCVVVRGHLEEPLDLAEDPNSACEPVDACVSSLPGHPADQLHTHTKGTIAMPLLPCVLGQRCRGQCLVHIEGMGQHNQFSLPLLSLPSPFCP